MFNNPLKKSFKESLKLKIVLMLKLISFSHVVWQGNAVAYALVQRVRHSFPLSVWMEHVPQDIVSFFLQDLGFS